MNEMASDTARLRRGGVGGCLWWVLKFAARQRVPTPPHATTARPPCRPTDCLPNAAEHICVVAERAGHLNKVIRAPCRVHRAHKALGVDGDKRAVGVNGGDLDVGQPVGANTQRRGGGGARWAAAHAHRQAARGGGRLHCTHLSATSRIMAMASSTWRAQGGGGRRGKSSSTRRRPALAGAAALPNLASHLTCCCNVVNARARVGSAPRHRAHALGDRWRAVGGRALQAGGQASAQPSLSRACEERNSAFSTRRQRDWRHGSPA